MSPEDFRLKFGRSRQTSGAHAASNASSHRSNKCEPLDSPDSDTLPCAQMSQKGRRMFLLTSRKAIAIAITLLTCSIALAARPANSDVIVLLNGNVITMNAKQPSAEAIAIQGERIVWIGSSA